MSVLLCCSASPIAAAPEAPMSLSSRLCSREREREREREGEGDERDRETETHSHSVALLPLKNRVCGVQAQTVTTKREKRKEREERREEKKGRHSLG